MENYCAFNRDHKCILWLDYEITRQELEECHTLCHGNCGPMSRFSTS